MSRKGASWCAFSLLGYNLLSRELLTSQRVEDTMPNLHLDGLDMHYQVEGEGQPLLLIHGLGSSGRDWELQVAYFADRYQVITLDMRGHGKSSKPPGPYSIPLFAGDTASVLEMLEVAPVHVVGISMGGMIAFQLAVDRPELVKSVVVVNSGPDFVIRSIKDRLQVWQRFIITRVLGLRKMAEVLGERMFPKPEHAQVRKVFVERWVENDKQAYQESMKAIVGWSVADRIGEIKCPALIIASDEDYTPVESKQAYVQQMPNAELAVIEDARHAVPVERPEQFNAVLEAFLSKQV